MRFLLVKFFLIISLFISGFANGDSHYLNEILEKIQKDIKTLEKAVYSGNRELNSGVTNFSSFENSNSEDVLTRHLLKLSEIENQFQSLTNKFEEINFKLDKLSNRMSKVQADNQMRFQNLESGLPIDETKNLTKKKKLCHLQ